MTAAYGEVRISDNRNSWGPRIHIDRADPQVRISAELLDEIEEGVEYAWLDGDVLTFVDDYGQRFVYLVKRDTYDGRSFEMEWPD